MKYRMLDAALWYQRKGLSVFPICPEKKRPLISWKPYQSRVAKYEELISWWGKWPNANIGMACGVVSNAAVIDCDTNDAILKIKKLLPGNLFVPLVGTPKEGHHYHFSHTPGLKNWVGVFPGVDIRTTGGQVLLPPSCKGNRVYHWFKGLGIHQVQRPPMPKILLQAIHSAARKDEPFYKTKNFEPNAYGAAALAGEIAAIAQAPKGLRNYTLNRSAYSLGQLLPGGELDVVQVRNALTAIAISIGLSHAEAKNTIESGLSGGAKSPRKITNKFEGTKRNMHANRKNKTFAKVQLIRPS